MDEGNYLKIKENGHNVELSLSFGFLNIVWNS